MVENISVHWLEDIIKEIYSRRPKEITLSIGKTPSGHIHLGILREIIICGVSRKIFEKDGIKVNNMLFI